MVNPFARKTEETPRSRLEGWLVKKLQGGWLKTLPNYVPLRGHGGHCPAQYARSLLAGLRSSGLDPATVERFKDDGRAFRGWAETALAPVPCRGADRNRGLVVG